MGDACEHWQSSWPAKTVHFQPKWAAKLPNDTKINLIKGSQWPVTHDETPQMLSSQ
jgi:hypothetical protein